MKTDSREYKVMLNPAAFSDVEEGLESLWGELQDLCKFLNIPASGGFDAGSPKERLISFLDTRDFTIRANGLLLRKRRKTGGDKAEYTLKLRSPDRCVAAEPIAARGLEQKFEEDIAVPFVSRFSQSVSVDHKGLLSTLGDAAGLFPSLGKLSHDDVPCPPSSPLHAVNGFEAFERVFKKAAFRFEVPDAPALSRESSVALILWTKGKKGRVWAAEVSFRYEDKGQVAPPVAKKAKALFEALQRTDFAATSGAMTKTQLMYMDS